MNIKVILFYLVSLFLVVSSCSAQKTCDSIFFVAAKYQQKNNPKKAISTFRSYLQCRHRLSYSSEAYLNIGINFYYLNEHDSSTENFRKAFQVSEDKSATMNQYAKFFLSIEQYDTLYKVCNQYIKQDSSNAAAYFYMGRCKWLSRLKILKENNVEDYSTDTALIAHLKKEILFLYGKAIYYDSIKNWKIYTTRPDSVAWNDMNSNYDYYVSRAFFEQNFMDNIDYENALKDFEISIMIHPTIQTYEYAAYIARRLGKKEKACKYIQQWSIMIPFPPTNDLSSDVFKKKEIANTFCKELGVNIKQ